jgi:hypothetical protein
MYPEYMPLITWIPGRLATGRRASLAHRADRPGWAAPQHRSLRYTNSSACLQPMSYPLRHVSIRVPWHDGGWKGTVCTAPTENDACLVLSRIRQQRDDAHERRRAGEDWAELSGAGLPPCVRERAGFMKPAEFSMGINHPYAERSPTHSGLGATTLRFPPYSAPCIPFRWMRREHAEGVAAEADIDYRPELEALADEQMPFTSGWVQHGHNQRRLLDAFFAHLQPTVSLCFFYAKRVPLTDDEGRR